MSDDRLAVIAKRWKGELTSEPLNVLVYDDVPWLMEEILRLRGALADAREENELLRVEGTEESRAELEDALGEVDELSLAVVALRAALTGLYDATGSGEYDAVDYYDSDLIVAARRAALGARYPNRNRAAMSRTCEKRIREALEADTSWCDDFGDSTIAEMTRRIARIAAVAALGTRQADSE